MAQINEEALIPVYIDDEQAKSALKNLQGEAVKWRKAMYEAMAAGDMKGMKEAERELKKTNQQISELKRSSFDVNKVLSNLSSASVKDLQKALSALRREQEGLNRNSKEYVAIQNKIDAIKGEFRQINGQITEQKGSLSKLKDVAAGLLPAFGWGAIAAGAAMAFKKIISATDDLSTRWEIFTGGLREGMNAFWRTMASGDWSNFFTNIERAINVGREYQAVLDELEARRRSLNVAEADSLKPIAELEEKVRNVTLTETERINAAEERIKIEENLEKKRSDIAQKGYDNQMTLAMNASKLSKERIEELIHDYDSGLKTQAEEYLQAKKKLDDISKSESRVSAMSGGVNTSLASSDEKKRLGAIVSSADAEVIRYANDLEKLNNATDDLLDTTVEAYKGVKEAENSAHENTKRIRSQMYSLINKESTKVETVEKKRISDVEKIEFDSIAEVEKALQDDYDYRSKINDLLRKAKEELAAAGIESLQDGLEKEEALENNRWENEKAALEQRLVMKSDASAEEMDLNNTIFQLIEAQEAEHQRRLANLKSAATISGLEDDVDEATPVDPNFVTLTEEQAFFDARVALIEAQYAKEKELARNNRDELLRAERKYNKDMRQVKVDLINAEFAIVERRIASGQSYINALAGFIDQESALGKALFIFSQGLAVADVWVQTAKSNAIIYAAALAKFAGSGPYAPALAAAWAASPIAANNVSAAINTGLIAAQTVAKFVKGKKAGGYADEASSDDLVAGVYHTNEFIASAPAVRNPTVKPILDIIDMAQRNGKIATLNLPAVLSSGGRRSGGYSDYSGSDSTSSTDNSYSGFNFNNPESIKAINRLNDALEKGIKAKLFYRDFENYDGEVQKIRDLANL